MILLFLWTVILSWRYYILVSYSNIRHLHNADSWFCPGFSESAGNLQKWPSSQHGSVRSLFFLFFFPFYFCLFCFPIYLFNKTNIFMTLSTYIWQRLVLTGATLFDNFFFSACTEMHFQAPKNSDTVLHVSLGDFPSSLAKV